MTTQAGDVFRYSPRLNTSYNIGHWGFPQIEIKPGEVIVVLANIVQYKMPCFLMMKDDGIIFKMEHIARPGFVRICPLRTYVRPSTD